MLYKILKFTDTLNTQTKDIYFSVNEEGRIILKVDTSRKRMYSKAIIKFFKPAIIYHNNSQLDQEAYKVILNPGEYYIPEAFITKSGNFRSHINVSLLD